MPMTSNFLSMESGTESAPAPLFLIGATGVGKSEIALAMARRDGAAILCMDAVQVYRGADIGTGKPTAAERAEISHGGVDLVDFGESFDVARYLEHVADFLRQQRAAGRPVLVVGGTGLYFRALTQGLCEAPQGSAALRAELHVLSGDELRARLARVDPGILAKIDASNPRRLTRAIEVMETTGRSLSAWQEETPPPLVKQFRAIWLQREKDELHSRIEARVEEMLAAGWVQEVMELRRLHSGDALQRFPGIGYRQIAEEIAMRADREYTVSPKLKRDISMATRQYAKRQLTWFAREPSLMKMMLSGSHLPELPSI